MAFWGAVITPRDAFQTQPPPHCEVLVVQACLDPASAPGAHATLWALRGEECYAIATLQKGGVESAALDLVLGSEMELFVRGNAISLHVTGHAKQAAPTPPSEANDESPTSEHCEELAVQQTERKGDEEMLAVSAEST